MKKQHQMKEAIQNNMAAVIHTGIEVVPTAREQVTSINKVTQKPEFDNAKFRNCAKINRELFIRGVEARRQKIASREKD